jgi:hypothetical protein
VKYQPAIGQLIGAESELNATARIRAGRPTQQFSTLIFAQLDEATLGLVNSGFD